MWLQNIDKGWVEEYRFHPERRWRFDFALPEKKLAIEIDGGIWNAGRHSRGKGQINDMEKGNAAVCLGWQILHFEPRMISDGYAMRVVQWIHEQGGRA